MSKDNKEITITISRYWPLSKLRKIEVELPDKIFRNSITLDPAQAKTLYEALKDVFEPEME